MFDKTDISSIYFDGFYLISDDGEELQPHNDFTYALYLQGLEIGGPYKDVEVYEGIVVEEGKFLAQIDREDKVQYIEIEPTQ